MCYLSCYVPHSATSTPPAPVPSHPSFLPTHSVGKQIVNVPSFVVRLDSQKHIDFALTSPYGGGRPGRVKRKRAKAAAGGGDDEAADEEDDE